MLVLLISTSHFFIFVKFLIVLKILKKRYTLKLNLAISLKYLVFYKNKKMASRY